MPFPLVAGLFVGNERWSGAGLSPRCVCDCAPLLQSVLAVRPEKLNEFFVHCSPVEYFVADVGGDRSSCAKVHSSGTYPLNLEPRLGDCFNAVRIIRVSGKKPVPSDCAAYVSCGVGLFQVPGGESETGATVPVPGSGIDGE
jgi:hypothetical protein